VRVPGRRVPALRRGYRGSARRGGGFVATTTLADIRSVPGLDDYLDALEERLARTVATHPGLVAAVGNEALAAGGKRLRPALVFLAAPPGAEPSLEAGVAVELVHMATLVHDDLIDRAHFRRGKAAAWSVYGPAAARATGDYLFARAFSELSATGDAAAVEILADATLSLARGEALQRTQTRDPGTTVDAYLTRCALKTGKLFEAACRLGGGSGEYGLALGIAFQIADDVLDCSGATIETGKIAGTDLRDGTPTLPLLLAAQQDAVVRSALAGDPMAMSAGGALVRVAATGALDEARDVALDYAGRARARLDGELHRDELEALTHAVVDRER
jgi:geranylgeranyl pyrophosphate synthase